MKRLFIAAVLMAGCYQPAVTPPVVVTQPVVSKPAAHKKTYDMPKVGDSPTVAARKLVTIMQDEIDSRKLSAAEDMNAREYLFAVQNKAIKLDESDAKFHRLVEANSKAADAGDWDEADRTKAEAKATNAQSNRIRDELNANLDMLSKVLGIDGK